MMSRPFKIIDQDLSSDPDLVSQSCGVGELFIETLLGSDLLTGMRFPRVDEDPVGVRKLVGDVAK